MRAEEKILSKLIAHEVGNAEDNLHRAKSAFKRYTPEQMNEQHGQSGRTRAEIMAAYEEWLYDCKSAQLWLEQMIKGETK